MSHLNRPHLVRGHFKEIVLKNTITLIIVINKHKKPISNHEKWLTTPCFVSESPKIEMLPIKVERSDYQTKALSNDTTH